MRPWKSLFRLDRDKVVTMKPCFSKRWRTFAREFCRLKFENILSAGKKRNEKVSCIRRIRENILFYFEGGWGKFEIDGLKKSFEIWSKKEILFPIPPLPSYAPVVHSSKTGTSWKKFDWLFQRDWFRHLSTFSAVF